MRGLSIYMSQEVLRKGGDKMYIEIHRGMPLYFASRFDTILKLTITG